MFDKLDAVKKRIEEITNLLGDPNIIANNRQYAKLAKELKNLQPIADMYDKYIENENNIKDAEEIAEYLDKKCREFDNLIESKERIVEELEQYKKSVIYEYVTGKKEVK